MSAPTDGDGARADSLDEGVVLCLEAAEAGHAPELVSWLARCPHLAAELAAFLADEAAVMPFTGPLRRLAAPAPLPQTVGWGAPAGEARGLPHVEGYEILSELGRGGMGVVYLANDLGLKRQVALKMLTAGPFASLREVQRFRFESEAVATLDHEHIVPIYAVCESDGRPFFSMKFLAGSLSARLRRDGPLAPREAARLVACVARAVHYAHQRGILHRDLKPANILLDGKGEPHVADFGLARRLDADASLQSTGGLVGTPAYASPEQARGDRGLTTAVDVYGLGGVLYEALTGQPPFSGDSLEETLTQIQTQPVVPPSVRRPDVEADLESICLRCLEKDAADRYPSAEAVADDLRRYLDGESPTARPSGFFSRVYRRASKAVGHRTKVPGLVTLAVFWWTILNVLALHVGIFLLAWGDWPVYWAWLLQLGFTAGGLCILWGYYHRQYDSLALLEKQTMALALGQLGANLALVCVSSPWSPLASTRDLLPTYYPALMVLTGLYVYALGMVSRGDCFVQGMAHLPVAVVLRLIPDWAPLIMAGFSCAYMVWMALDWRRTLTNRNTQENHS